MSSVRLTIRILAWLILATVSHPVCRGEIEDGEKTAIESASPDGRFAFRYSDNAETEAKSYDLISQPSGKVLAHVAKNDVDIGSSGRFNMKVLWRPDSKAFALTATLWKRGSYVAVFLRDGATFRKVNMPELLAEIPDKVKRGKEFPHIMELNSQSPKRWQKDGSLIVEIENIQDGNDGTITANRTVVLSFAPSGKAKVVKSTIKFSTETP